ncbi:MAG: aminopeptidase P family protein [Firmicutes bacterium]|nr:aminopeptidase P family protein [Bacillota bacterium]
MSAEDRRRRVRSRMQALELDVLALPPGADTRYLLGATPHPDERLAVLLVTQERLACAVPALNELGLRRDLGDLDVALLPWADAEGPDAALDRAVDLLGLGRRPVRLALGTDMRADHVLALVGAFQRAGVEVWPPAALSRDVVAPERARKDPEELALLAASAALADEAMEAGLAAIAPGRRESDVAQAVAQTFARHGAAAKFSLVAAGPNSAEPHHPAGARPIERGEPVFLDIGCDHRGYQSDLTRMAFVGRPDDRYRAVHDTVRRAAEAGLAAVRPGARAEDVDRAARRVIEEAGYGAYFVHRTGHGIGLEGHEPPSMQEGDRTVLEEGMTFSIEPGIYIPGAFGVRIEDIVVVEAGGGRPLSRLGHEVHVVD